MDKFVITVPKNNRKPAGWKPITVTSETFEQIIALQERTGLSRNKLVDMCISYALEHLEIRFEQETDE